MAKKKTEKEVVIGTVTDCAKLNVRKRPNKDAEVVCVIEHGTKVEILAEPGGFFKICLASGIKGYCMKEFIAI